AGDNSRRQDRVPGQGGFAAGAALELKIENKGDTIQLYKVKCTKRRGLQPRHRRLEHEGANAVGHGQEGAGHQTSLRALRTRIGRKRKMRDDHEDKICHPKRKKDFVYTASSSAACGAYLEIGKEYLIGGNYFDYDTKKKISSCGLVKNWDDISVEIKEDLNNGKLDKNCTY
uniref:NTR domain-containing protein n=1 Tax=Meloidogyne floridensis TaxID=298350 RepID=A0A915NLL1_9BILA